MKDTKDQTTTNTEVNLQSDALTDLPVGDEEANETKAGGAPNGRLFLGTEVGVYVS
jgi:hypothetical protein